MSYFWVYLILFSSTYFVVSASTQVNSNAYLGLKEKEFFAATYKYIEEVLNVTENSNIHLDTKGRINSTEISIKWKNFTTSNVSFLYNPTNNYLVCDLNNILCTIRMKKSKVNATYFDIEVQKFYIELQFDSINSTNLMQSQASLTEFGFVLNTNNTNLPFNISSTITRKKNNLNNHYNVYNFKYKLILYLNKVLQTFKFIR